MKKKNLFDMLENAEDELMNDFTDMSPEISDEQLEKLLAVSERNYKVKKEEIERTRKDNDMTADADAVSGVDRVKRPVWLTPLLTAASVVLIGGAVFGSVALLKNNRNNINGGGDDTNIGHYQTQPDLTGLSGATAGSATDTTVTETTATTTAAVTTETAEELTSDTKAQDITVDDSFARYAYDMWTKGGDINALLNDVGIERERVFLRFAVDPELGYSIPNFHENTEEILENTVLYSHVTDTRFTCTEDLRSYARTVFTEDRIREWGSEKTFSSGFDDIDEGDLLPADKIGHFIDYRGKLYIRCTGGGTGYLPAGDYIDELPVIIYNKTDTSFTAYIQNSLFSYNSDTHIEELKCYEVKFVLDPEFNDWRIDDEIYRDAPVYKTMYDKLKELQ